jgi:hypothetical protein
MANFEVKTEGAFEGSNEREDNRILKEMEDQHARNPHGSIHVPAWSARRVIAIMRELRTMKVNLADDGK